MKYYIISGEASGDLHGSNLMKELHKLDARADFRCWGGDLMEAAGGKLVKHYRELAFMGFAEVIQNLGTIFKNISFCKKDIKAYQPDVLILVDYPGFNLRIAKWARLQGLKIVYYISPQIWAWKESRIHSIKKNVDKMLVILPFEKEFYARWNFKAEYVGHPLVEVVDDFQRSQVAGQWSIVNGEWAMVNGEWAMVNGQWSIVNGQYDRKSNTVNDDPLTNDPTTNDPITNDPLTNDPLTNDPTTNDPITNDPLTNDPITNDPLTNDPLTNDPTINAPMTSEPMTNALIGAPKIIALLPGSRQQEILKKLPIMLQVADHFADYQFVLAKAPGLASEFYESLVAPYKNVASVSNKTYDLLSQATAALVTSGTATLETALFAVPEVVCYKGNKISYHIARKLIKIKYISLVNLIMDKEVVKELIQDELKVENLVKELKLLLFDEAKKETLQKDYKKLRTLLSAGGHASCNAAKSIYAMLSP